MKQGLEILRSHFIFVQGDSRQVMPAADVAITKSGSVNLELALLNVSTPRLIFLNGGHEIGLLGGISCDISIKESGS